MSCLSMCSHTQTHTLNSKSKLSAVLLIKDGGEGNIVSEVGDFNRFNKSREQTVRQFWRDQFIASVRKWIHQYIQLIVRQLIWMNKTCLPLCRCRLCSRMAPLVATLTLSLWDSSYWRRTRWGYPVLAGVDTISMQKRVDLGTCAEVHKIVRLFWVPICVTNPILRSKVKRSSNPSTKMMPTQITCVYFTSTGFWHHTLGFFTQQR